MNLSDLDNVTGAVLATNDVLPAIAATGYEYVIAGNGLFIRAEDSRMEAMVNIVPLSLRGLRDVEPYARLKTPKVPADYLWSVLISARNHLPAERMYQFHWNAHTYGWECRTPVQTSTSVSIQFTDAGAPAIDLHSHGSLDAYFSSVDDADEQGLRFYVVIGRLHYDHGNTPNILSRVGVYGHHAYVPASDLFDVPYGPLVGPFDDLYNTKAYNDVELPF